MGPFMILLGCGFGGHVVHEFASCFNIFNFFTLPICPWYWKSIIAQHDGDIFVGSNCKDALVPQPLLSDLLFFVLSPAWASVRRKSAESMPHSCKRSISDTVPDLPVSPGCWAANKGSFGCFCYSCHTLLDHRQRLQCSCGHPRHDFFLRLSLIKNPGRVLLQSCSPLLAIPPVHLELLFWLQSSNHLMVSIKRRLQHQHLLNQPFLPLDLLFMQRLIWLWPHVMSLNGAVHIRFQLVRSVWPLCLLSERGLMV